MASKRDVRAFFNQLRQKFLDWNSVDSADERYKGYEKEISELYLARVKEL